MRFALGIGGLLVGVGVFVVFYSAVGGESHQQAVDARNTAQEQLNPLGGRDAEGNVAGAKTTLVATERSGRLVGLLVTQTNPTDPYVGRWGLAKGDVIVQIGVEELRGSSTITTQQDAETFLLEAYTRGRPIEVMRDEQRVELPLTAAPGQQDVYVPGSNRGGALDAIRNQAGGQ